MGLLRIIRKLFGTDAAQRQSDASNERPELIPSDAMHRLRDEDVRAAVRDGKAVFIVFPDGDRVQVQDARPGIHGRN